MSKLVVNGPDVLRQLAQRIEEIEAGGQARRATVPLGIPALDGILPARGLAGGSLVELLSSADGAGAWTLALLMARQAAGERKRLVVVDGTGSFYPPAAARWGLDVSRVIVVRPRTARDACAAVNLSLRCSAIGAVIARCDRLNSLEFRSLQLAAEAGGGIGFLLRSVGQVSKPVGQVSKPAKPLAVEQVSQPAITPGRLGNLPHGFAAVRLLITPVASADKARRLQIDVLRCRGGKNGQSIIVEIDSETGAVRLPAPLAAAAAGARPARAAR